MIEPTFLNLCEQSFRDNFELPALTDYGTEKSYTYEEVAKEIAKWHIFFNECNIKPEDKIALIGKNNSQWCVVYLAIVTYGAVIVPILQDFSPNDVHNIVNHSDSLFLFVSDSIWENLEHDKMGALRGVVSLNDFRLLFQQKNEKFDLLLLGLDEKFSLKYPKGFTREDIAYVDLPKDKVAIINFTSGTTGFSKGVIITGDNLVGNLLYARKEMDLRRKDKLLSLLPLAHAYGCAFEFLYPLMEGCCVILLGKTPSPKVLLKAFNEVKPRLIIAVPLILEKIYRNMILPLVGKKMMRFALKIPVLGNYMYSLIRKQLVNAFGGNFIQVVIGGAPLNSEVEDFLLKIKFPISLGYGMTESAPLISFSVYQEYVPHSCGKVLPCMNVRIDSSDPANIAGEIQVKGQNVMQGYYKNEKANKDTFTEDGWLKTGDLGTIDKNNNVFIRGRLKSMILSASGQNIYPEEIEAKLDNLPYVIESLVVEKNGHLTALVFPDYTAAEENKVSRRDLDLIMTKNKETLNNMVASYEKISKIELISDEFEKTPKKSIKRYMYNAPEE